MDKAQLHQLDSVLCYANDRLPGYRRVRQGNGFAYFDSEGVEITDSQALDRFRNLHIPPAWEGVWIAPDPRGHIQATGRDRRGRKQYVYHREWVATSSMAKFDRLIAFARTLPKLREHVDRALDSSHLSRQTALAFAVRIMEQTMVRIGSKEYVHENRSYGVTTLRDYHVCISDDHLEMRFRGKSRKQWDISIRDIRLARLAKKFQELPGQELLRYEDDSGRLRTLDSADVNNFLKEIAGEEFTAKDFRTWGGTVGTAVELYNLGPGSSESEQKKNLLRAIRRTAWRLGNTPTACRNYYVHPLIFDGYRDGTLIEAMKNMEESTAATGLTREERCVVRLLTAGSQHPYPPPEATIISCG